MPTNITPDYLGSLGNGIVPPTLPLSVTWQVNGNSPMTAFKIDFYENSDVATLMYSTGKLTDGCPFYGTDSLGNKQMFAYDIDDQDLLDVMDAYTDLKLVITQWWSNDDYVVQASPSAFTVKENPTITLPVSTVTTREATFTATYSQADGDALNWVRWQIAYNSDTGKANPFYDSGNIYNTALLQTTYDGFFSGTIYAIKCMIETQSGVTADTGWVAFPCNYNMQTLTGTVEATQACHKSAVKVEWNGFRYISGQATGPYDIINDGEIDLPTGSSVRWDEVNGTPMSLTAPWYLAYKGTLVNADAELFSIEMDEEDVLVLDYVYASRQLILKLNNTAKATISNVSSTATVVAVVTADRLYYRLEYMTGGLYPSDTLYPANTLYPADDTIPAITVHNVAISYTQGNITGVEMYGAQHGDYLQVIEGTATVTTPLIVSAITEGTYTPTPTDGTVFLADFMGDLSAGTLYISGTEIDGWAIYRNDIDNNFMHVADVPMEDSVVYDYSARSQQGPYTYYVYPIGTDTYITQPMISNTISPRFWDWTILECSRDVDGTFELVREFRFNKNVSTNAMSNNNSPSISKNFTPYPTVQLSNQNYHSSSFTALIGDIALTDGTLTYYDTLARRDAIESLSTTLNHLFLKNRKGDLMEIRLAGEVSFATADNSPTQALTVTIPWVQIGEATKASIIAKGE